MIIEKLRTNHLENPIGYKIDSPVFSWIVTSAEGEDVTCCQFQISKDIGFSEIIYDSGKKKNIDSLGYAPDFIPEPGIRYYWHVYVKDNSGDEGTSEAAFFELAKPMKKGKWITAPFEKNIQPLLIRKLELRQRPVKAMLYITGLGVYEAYINGKKIGDEILAPFHNDYNLWLQYQTYDVTDMIKAGDNCLGVMLGNGWYKGRFGFIDKLDELYGDTLKMICELHLTYQDGKTEIIPSDERFLCAPSPVIESSIYDGESYDANKEIKDWCTIKADEGLFKPAVKTSSVKAKLTPRLSVPVTIQEKIKPIELITTKTGEKVLDFGQNMTGWVEFNCSEKKGTEVFFQFGEILQEGVFYNENLRTAKEEFRYICNGNKVKVRPHFTFYGFRYMKVKGIENININDFTGCVIHSKMDRTGYIKTSNKKINQLFHNALWGQKGNFLDVPTDCPQRDERMGWTGDAQVFSATASLNMYTPAFYRKYLYDMKLEQDTLEGSVPHVVPDILGQIHDILNRKKRGTKNVSVNTAHGSCAWGDAATVIPWNIYMSFGDKTLLSEEYSNMKAWTDYIRYIDKTYCGGKYLWMHGFHYADWLALDNYHKDSSFGATDPYYVASVYYYYSASLTAKAADVLGNEKDKKYYTDIAEKIKEAIIYEYFTPSGRLAVDTQTALALSLYFGLHPQKAKTQLLNRLIDKLNEDNMHLSTGFVGTPFLCPVLAENGHQDKAYTLLLNEDFPSWLYEVNMGATTIWERWNSVLPDGSISDTGMNSLNHYAYGSIVEWMYRYMCGLNMTSAGYKTFVIKPYTDNRFKWATMSYDSASGRVESSWKKVKGGYLYTLEIPFATTAEFVLINKGRSVKINGIPNDELLSKGKIKLKKGKYEIEVLD